MDGGEEFGHVEAGGGLKLGVIEGSESSSGVEVARCERLCEGVGISGASGVGLLLGGALALKVGVAASDVLVFEIWGEVA